MAKRQRERIYITVYRPVCGWKAVLMSSTEGPIQTGFFAFRTREEAVREALYWGECEEIPVRV